MNTSRRRCDSALPHDAGRAITPIDVLQIAGLLLMRHTKEVQDGSSFMWESSTGVRVLIRLDNGMESDVEVDKVTRCFRGWVNGVEVGSPEWN